MKYIQRYGFLALLGLVLAGCGTPQAMLFNVDVLQPKKFTLAVDEQPVAVVATYKDKASDSTSSANLALGAARYIETGNALDEGSVGAFTIPEEEYTGAGDKEYMEGLMLATGSETLVIVRDIEMGDVEVSRTFDEISGMSIVGILPVKANMDVYDAIADTTIFSERISDNLKFHIPLDQNLTQQGISAFLSANDSLIVSAVGALLAKHISYQWIEEEWMLIDYPEESAWHNAYKDAMDFKWEEAIKAWMPLTEDKNSEKASYAAFNIAVACQMLGQTDLAIEWLAFGRSKFDFSEARQLSLYLNNHKKTLERINR
ncbi:MAG: hypothetical protein IKS82_02740 [Bacteroidales bacterium]|nr:hypothetical protein [Bacteroidales bacterium]